MFSLNLLYLVFVFFQFTASGEESFEIKCVRVDDCPMAMKLLETGRSRPETLNFLRSVHCGFEGDAPKIWCTLIDVCVTPDGKSGICTEVKHCRSFLNLTRFVDKSDLKVRSYLNGFRCGGRLDPAIKVCCPYGRNKYSLMDVEDRFLPSVKPPMGEKCGLQSSENRIYGGTLADIDEFPWMALLKYSKNNGFVYGCGGSLISSRFVLTAAHCLDSLILRRRNLKKLYRVILGEYDVRNVTDCIYHKYGKDCAPPATEHEIESIIIHPGYFYGSTDHDVGIIKLSRSVQFTDFVKPICLPDRDLVLNGSDIYMIAGWGRTTKDNTSAVKRKARVEVAPNQRCEEYSGRLLEESQICAGGGDGDSCFGDSGGPLMLGRNVGNQYTNFVVGVISYGFAKTCGAKPSVYTYVPYYVDWINNNSV